MGTFGIIVSRLLSKASSKFKDGGWTLLQRPPSVWSSSESILDKLVHVQPPEGLGSHSTTGYLDNRCYRELRSYLRHINVFSKISKESTSFYHIHEKYSVYSTFLYNWNSKCCVVRILYAISFQWSKCFGYREQQIILKLTITNSRCWQSGTTMT